MGLLGKLMIHLGLKDKEFQDGMKKAKDSVGGFGQAMQTLKASAIGAWTAISETIIKWTGKFVNDFLTSTQKIGDKWNETMAGLKAGYHSFIASLASGEGWRQLFANMQEASRLAREAARSLDEVFERKMSFNVEAADINRQIALQRQVMRDASKSEAERKKAAEEIIRLEEKLGMVKKDIWAQEAEARRKELMGATGLSANQIKYLVDDYNKNRDEITKAREYLEKRANLQGAVTQAKAGDVFGGGTSANTIEAERALKNFDSTTDLNIRRIAKWIQAYDKSNDELVSNYAKAVSAVTDIDTEVINGSLRASTFLGSQGGGSGKGNGQADEIIQQMLGDLDLMQKYNNGKIEVEFPVLIKPDIRMANDSSYFSILGEGVDEYEALFKEMSDTITEQFEELNAKCMQLGEEFRDAAIYGFSEGIQTIMDGVMGLEDLNAGSVLQALLTPLADLAIKQGELTMAQGIAVKAIGESLKSLDGAPAIAAGAALIAVGSAVKSGLASLASSMGGGASASSATTATNTMANSVTSEEIVVRVEGKISGNDILISGQRTSNQWNR